MAAASALYHMLVPLPRRKPHICHWPEVADLSAADWEKHASQKKLAEAICEGLVPVHPLRHVVTISIKGSNQKKDILKDVCELQRKLDDSDWCTKGDIWRQLRRTLIGEPDECFLRLAFGEDKKRFMATPAAIQALEPGLARAEISIKYHGMYYELDSFFLAEGPKPDWFSEPLPDTKHPDGSFLCFPRRDRSVRMEENARTGKNFTLQLRAEAKAPKRPLRNWHVIFHKDVSKRKVVDLTFSFQDYFHGIGNGGCPYKDPDCLTDEEKAQGFKCTCYGKWMKQGEIITESLEGVRAHIRDGNTIIHDLRTSIRFGAADVSWVN